MSERSMPEAEAFAGILPHGFDVGVSSSAFQIEGAVHTGGRELSVWDAFTHQPGRIANGADADVAADHFGRVSEDVALLARLGVDSYSFSFAWPRLQPRGTGMLNREGIAFYDRLIDELLATGIRPSASLFHWDTPVELGGGWLNRDTAQRFGDYAHQAGEVFGDRIARWVTVTEPAAVMLNGYALGVHAPGSTLLFDALPAGHNLLLGHGLAVQALRAASVTGAVGIQNVYSPVEAVTQSGDDLAVASLFDTLQNRMFGDAVLLGHYPEVPSHDGRLLRALVEAPTDDLATIHQPLDFYGVDYFFPTRIAAGSLGGARTVSPLAESSALSSLPFRFGAWPDVPATGTGWPNAPEYLAVALAELAVRYGDALPPVHLTGGVGAADVAEVDAMTGTLRVTDVARIDYLSAHLAAALDAVAVGGAASAVTLAGYSVWSFLDGFDWTSGYGRRFGLVHVDSQTQDRTVKASFDWVQRVLEARR